MPRRLPAHASSSCWRCSALVAALVMVIRAGQQRHRGITADGAVAVDGPALFLQGTLIVLGIVALLLIGRAVAGARRPVRGPGRGHRRHRGRPRPGRAHDRARTEVFPLTLFALGGMMLFVAANDLLTMFVALEVFSLPLYLLCALARRRRLLSQEAALKYFLLGAFASAFFLFGMALLYGFAGPVDFAGIHAATLGSTQRATLLLFAGLAMLAVGLLFKVAAVPFHVWTPDVYQGAPTPVTALMAACTKVAAFGGLLRVLYVAFDRAQWDYPAGARHHRDPDHAGRRDPRGDPDRHQAAARLLVDRQRRATCWSACSRSTRTACPVVAVLPGRVRLHGDRRVRASSRWCATPTARRPTCPAGPGSAGARRCSPALFTFLLLAFAGIPLTSGFTSKFARLRGGASAAGRPGWSSSAW